MIAHTLNAIIGYSEMLEEEAHDSATVETVQDLQKIKSAGKHLLALINDGSTFPRSRRKDESAPGDFRSVRMIEEIVTTLQPAIEKNSNTLLGASGGRM